MGRGVARLGALVCGAPRAHCSGRAKCRARGVFGAKEHVRHRTGSKAPPSARASRRDSGQPSARTSTRRPTRSASQMNELRDRSCDAPTHHALNGARMYVVRAHLSSLLLHDVGPCTRRIYHRLRSRDRISTGLLPAGRDLHVRRPSHLNNTITTHEVGGLA